MITSTTAGGSVAREARPLTDKDFDAVVALDKRISGRSRRAYFERRLEAARSRPKRHLQLAMDGEAGLVGFLLARRAGGEFGRAEEHVVLEAIGVDPARQRSGVGRHLMAGLVELSRARDIRHVRTHVEWSNHGMLRFLDGAGFSLAPSHILSRPVHRMPLPDTDEEIEKVPPTVRLLRDGDLDAISRIDFDITGDNRKDYLARKVDEALRESAIAVSLVVEDDGFVTGYAMSRVDHGNFGHIEPVASLDTIGVKPSFGKRGLARAMLTQMIDNLSAIDVRRLETEVAHDDLELLRFLYRFGFGPSQRLSFQRAL